MLTLQDIKAIKNKEEREKLELDGLEVQPHEAVAIINDLFKFQKHVLKISVNTYQNENSRLTSISCSDPIEINNFGYDNYSDYYRLNFSGYGHFSFKPFSQKVTGKVYKSKKWYDVFITVAIENVETQLHVVAKPI